MNESQNKVELVVSGIERQVCEDIAKRQQHGIAKYGKTVADNDLSDLEWMQHHYEELLDAAVYVKKRIENAKRTNSQ